MKASLWISSISQRFEISKGMNCQTGNQRLISALTSVHWLITYFYSLQLLQSWDFSSSSLSGKNEILRILQYFIFFWLDWSSIRFQCKLHCVTAAASRANDRFQLNLYLSRLYRWNTLSCTNWVYHGLKRRWTG